MSPRRLAAAIASVRLMTFNFVKTLLTCAFTVVWLMKRSVPISLLLLPRARRLAHQLRGNAFGLLNTCFDSFDYGVDSSFRLSGAGLFPERFLDGCNKFCFRH
jgi:hypothetical protein